MYRILKCCLCVLRCIVGNPACYDNNCQRNFTSLICWAGYLMSNIIYVYFITCKSTLKNDWIFILGAIAVTVIIMTSHVLYNGAQCSDPYTERSISDTCTCSMHYCIVNTSSQLVVFGCLMYAHSRNALYLGQSHSIPIMLSNFW